MAPCAAKPGKLKRKVQSSTEPFRQRTVSPHRGQEGSKFEVFFREKKFKVAVNLSAAAEALEANRGAIIEANSELLNIDR